MAWSVSRLHDLQIVGHRENAGDAVGADRDQVLVGFAVDHTFQSDASVLHDDTDGLLHAQGVFFQWRVAVDGAVQLQTEVVVHGRGGQDFDLVVDFFDAFNVLDGVLGIRLERRPRDLSQQDHVVAVNFVGDIVEHSKLRKHEKFVTDFLGDALLGAG
jgi:hypothetical protein